MLKSAPSVTSQLSACMLLLMKTGADVTVVPTWRWRWSKHGRAGRSVFAASAQLYTQPHIVLHCCRVDWTQQRTRLNIGTSAEARRSTEVTTGTRSLITYPVFYSCRKHRPYHLFFQLLVIAEHFRCHWQVISSLSVLWGVYSLHVTHPYTGTAAGMLLTLWPSLGQSYIISPFIYWIFFII